MTYTTVYKLWCINSSIYPTGFRYKYTYFLAMRLREVVGANVRRLRISKKWPQEKLSVRAEMSLSFIGELERGKVNVSVDSMEKIAKALDVEPEELMEKRD